MISLKVRLLYFYVKLSKIIVLLCQFFFLKKNLSQRKKLIMAINPIYKTTDDNMIYQNLRCFFFFKKENT